MSLDRLLEVYRARLLAEGERTADEVDRLLERLVLREDGTFAEEDAEAEFGALAAGAMTQGTARASILGQQFLATYATIALGRIVLPVGLPPAQQADPGKWTTTIIKPTAAERSAALAQANADIRDLQVRQTIARRAARKQAAAEVADAGRRALGDAMDATPGVQGWTRATSGSSCPDCRALADGTVLPPTTRMSTHPACDCVARPVTTGRTPR